MICYKSVDGIPFALQPFDLHVERLQVCVREVACTAGDIVQDQGGVVVGSGGVG